MTSLQAQFAQNPKIIDSHCHLDLLEKEGFDIDKIISEASLNDVAIIQTICTKISEIDNILKYAHQYKNVFASIGNHPCNITQEKFASCSEIIDIIDKNKKIIGIGETGLDYYHPNFDVNLQKKSFVEHIKASQESGLPVIIHSRNADADMLDILTSEQKNKTFPALLHCFSSSKELAYKSLDLGIYISIAGIVTFSNAKELKDIVKNIPLKMMLVETDSPYLAPMPHRGKKNQPSYVKNTVEYIAALKQTTWQEIAIQTSDNFFQLFRKCS